MSNTPTNGRSLAVIGAGPGGYVAAFHAADRGFDVTLIDRASKPGGVCLREGCIPSKALLHAARLIEESREAEEIGLKFGKPEIDVDQLREWKNKIIDKLATGTAQLAKRRRVRILQSTARFRDSLVLDLKSTNGDAPESLAFDHGIIATGSAAVIPRSLELDDPRVMDSSTALDLPELPGRLLVVGGGYIGLELGTVYAALGSKVTVVEMTDGLLPGVDPDLVRPLERRLRERFEAIHLGTQVERLEARDEGVIAHLKGKQSEPQIFDRVLIAVGRRPNSRGLGLENTEVVVGDDGFVRVDRRRRTDDPRISAIGDVAGQPMLAHKASREGKVVAEVLSGEPAEFDNAAIPAVVFTDPEIAWCGLTEAEAKQSGEEVRIKKFPWTASGRAMTLGRTEGLTKLIVEPETNRVLGMGVVGVGAGELIAEGTLAVEMGATARDLAETIHTHPTLSETVAEAAEAVLGQATHLYEPKRR